MNSTAVIKLVVLLALTGALLWASRRSLRQPGTHGFYRFFAFEAIAALCVLAVDFTWFDDFFSVRKLVSLILLLLSVYLVVEAVVLLHRVGKPKSPGEPREAVPATATAQEDLYDFEQTTHLVTTGLYRYIRHPMYSSLLCLAWGLAVREPSYLGFALAIVATVFIYATARADEREDIARFGDEYVQYMRTTKRFIPFAW